MAAPWKSLLKDHIASMQSAEFALSTIKHTASGPRPKVRTCISRGFWTEIDYNPKNPAPRNPKVYSSSCLTFTTDVRMEKLADLMGNSKDLTSSGGGGYVEALYWMKDKETQWRIAGQAYVLSEKDIDDANHVQDALLKRMTRSDSDSNAKWSWKGEVFAHYGNLSPGMRGSFTHPPPGTPSGLSKDVKKQAQAQEPAPSDKLGNPIKEIDNPKERENFRVVVIAPEVVEQAFLSSEPNKQRRWRYTLKDSSEEDWEIEELWP